MRLDTRALAVDALGMDRLLAAGTVEAILQASAGWAGELLDGVSSPGTAFDHWGLEAERASRHAAMLHALEGAVTEAERSGREPDIEALARALLRVDPADERAHRILIDLQARKGAIGAALRQFEQCRKALAHSLDIEPSAELRLACRSPSGARSRQARRRGMGRAIPHRTPVVAVFVQPAIGPPELVRDLSQILEDELVTALSRYRTFSTRLIASPEQAAEAGPELLAIGLRHDGTACRYGLRLCDTATNLQHLAEALAFPAAADLALGAAGPGGLRASGRPCGPDGAHPAARRGRRSV